MSVDLFFAVPILVHDADEALRDAIAARVVEYLESDAAGKNVIPSPEESVKTSYYQEDRSIIEDAGLEQLEELVLGAASSFLERSLGLPRRELEIERAWINVFEPGDQETQHTHDGSLLSCSYYVEAPENCGCIVFPDPIGERRSYRHFTQTRGKGLLTRGEIAVEPKPGRLVMFESWFGHAVQCNKSDARRISIAINLRAAPLVAGVADSETGQENRQPESTRNESTQIESSAVKSGRPVASAAEEAGQPPPRPFLFNDVFDVYKNLHLTANPIADAIPTVVIDGVLKDAERARDVIGRMPAANWKHEAGGRNFVDYYDCRLRIPIRYPTSLISVAQKAIQQVYATETRPADASVDVNWFMQINDKRGEFAVPHCDITEKVNRSFTCIVYLNREDECSGGTAFFRFRQSGALVIDEAYAKAVQTDSRISETGLDYWPEDPDRHWEQVGAVDMVPGRMLIFPSEFFHAAYHPVDSFLKFPRLTLAFWMIN